jgi:hypothetical protein
MPAALKLRAPSHPKGDANRFCGPSAISAATGMGTGEAARLLRAATGKRSIKGTSTGAVLRVLAKCGVRHARATHQPGDTLAGWLRSTHGRRGGKVFLVVAGHHFQLISGSRYVCGRVGAVVELDHPKVKRRARVEEVYELTAPNGVTIPSTARKPPPSPYQREKAQARSTAQKTALAWGLRIDRERDGFGLLYWVYGPEGVYDDEEECDPCQGSHSCSDWTEVMQCVTAYVEDLTERGFKPGGATE